MRQETLAELHSRISKFNQSSLPLGKTLTTNPNLTKKVNSDGTLLAYQGNTTVFTLDNNARRQIRSIQNRLYSTCHFSLAERLCSDTFHITLHDLLSDSPSQKLLNSLQDIQPKAQKLVKDINARNESIQMQSTFLFNMVNTSMVLGFEPVDEESCQILMRYYQMFQDVVPLNYALTPHVTLAYFKPGHINAEQVQKLQNVIDFVKQRPPIFTTLCSQDLQYQFFLDMNIYRTLPNT